MGCEEIVAGRRGPRRQVHSPDQLQEVRVLEAGRIAHRHSVRAVSMMRSARTRDCASSTGA